jgi:hypothetical protein
MAMLIRRPTLATAYQRAYGFPEPLHEELELLSLLLQWQGIDVLEVTSDERIHSGVG